MLNNKIIAITGNARAGKDTVANIILKFIPSVNVFTYADLLKKEVMLKLEIDSLEELNRYKNENIPYNGINIRKFIQEFADSKKEIDPHYYSSYIINSIKDLDNDCPVLITDLRMLIEEKDLKETFKNLNIIKVKRDIEPIKENKHISETEIDLIEDCITVYNDGTKSDLDVKIKNIIKHIL